MSMLSPILATGNVAFCPMGQATPCEIVSAGHSYPNGLLWSHVDQQLYLPSSGAGHVQSFKTQADGSLELAREIGLPHPPDNLSEDQNGDIWVAVIPRFFPDFLRHTWSPFTNSPPSSVFKISRSRNGTYQRVDKILEDRDGEVMPGTTTAVHDAGSGKLFLVGELHEFECNYRDPADHLSARVLLSVYHGLRPDTLAPRPPGFDIIGGDLRDGHRLFTRRRSNALVL